MADILQNENFKLDCLNLISCFKAHKSADFVHFTDEWKRQNFTYVFFGHTYDYELLQSTENCFLVLKNIFITLATITDRIGALYLMYAMYFKQPTKEYCKYRFTITDWYEMKSFYNQIHADVKYIQVRMVFWRLWRCNAFRFVESELDFGLESTMTAQNRNENVLNFQKIMPQMLDMVGMLKDESSGLLTGMDILQAGYNEMKEHLAKANENCTGLRALNMVGTLAKEMDEIENNFLAPVPKRRKKGDRRGQKGRKTSTTELNESNEEGEILDDNDDLDEDSASTVSECERNASTNTEDSDGECLNIGMKRIYLKRKAMNKTAKTLIHGSSYAATGQVVAVTPLEETKPPRSPKKNTKSTTALLGDSTGDETMPKAKKKVQFDDERGTVRIMQASNKRKPRSKNSAVKKQFNECPPEASAELDPETSRNDLDDESD